MRRELIKDSKFLSLVLRHDPSAIGVELDEAGWIEVAVLLEALQRKRPHITMERLIEIVETNDKKRFAISEDGERIRASQGHSIEVDLGLPETAPPALLYHGTPEYNLKSIQDKGLLSGQRRHVHLSADEATAMKVGARRGKPVILAVDAEKMSRSGFTFPESIHRHIREIAKQEGVSINQLISSAVSEKVSALLTEEYIQARANRADFQKVDQILANVPDRDPAPEDLR